LSAVSTTWSLESSMSRWCSIYSANPLTCIILTMRLQGLRFVVPLYQEAGIEHLDMVLEIER